MKQSCAPITVGFGGKSTITHLRRSRLVVVDDGRNRGPFWQVRPVSVISPFLTFAFINDICRNPATMGLCSKCYRETQSSVENKGQGSGAATAAGRPEPAPTPAAVEEKEIIADKSQEQVLGTETAPVGEEENKQAVVSEKAVQKNRGRCFSCNKKVGLLGFECRCGYVYCTGHRHAADHACTFDFASFDRDRLAKANPVVAAAKVDKF